ncbi:MAG: hypothetical protein FDX18_06795, partial [Chlorobium sp.]
MTISISGKQNENDNNSKKIETPSPTSDSNNGKNNYTNDDNKSSKSDNHDEHNENDHHGADEHSDDSIITGNTTASLIESNSLLTAKGTLTIISHDDPTSFIAKSLVAGSNNYGTFSLTKAGVWSYTTNSAHNEFVSGKTYTDSFTAKTTDGTEQVITVTITGTNDAAVITGKTSATLVETNSALTTTGTLAATDVDSPNTFVAQTNVSGTN